MLMLYFLYNKLYKKTDASSVEKVFCHSTLTFWHTLVSSGCKQGPLFPNAIRFV